MISCFKRSAPDNWKPDFENTYAASYTSTSDLSQNGPKISEIVDSFKKYDSIKYAAYRAAFKIRTIQKASKLHLVDLAVINSILTEHCGSSQLDVKISTESVSEIISTLYSEVSKRIGFATDPDVMAHLFCAFLKNAFVENENSLFLVQMKIALILFSSGKLSEKHKYMFYHCSSDGVMNKSTLSMLLRTLSKLAEIVGEQVTFGSHLVPNAVQNCLKFCKGRITEKRFKKWLALDPQTLVWVSTLHRIAIAETTEHFVSCDFCQTSPMLGLRYKCLQCLNYNLCQNCFLRGCYNKAHKEGHFVQEFCLPATVWQETKAIFNTVKNKIYKKSPNKPYLSFDDESVCDSSEVFSNPSVQKLSIRNCSIRKSTSAYLIKELSSIISQLEEDKKQIAVLESVKENGFSNGTLNVRKDLQKIDSNFEAQLGRLKELVKALKTPNVVKKETGVVSPVPHVPFHRKEHFFESTPMNSVAPLQSKENLQDFSPQSVDTTRVFSKKPYNQSSDYSSQSFNSDKENFAFSSSSNQAKSPTNSISFELTTFLNKSSPKSPSTKLSELKSNLSELSPLYVCSSLNLEEPKSNMIDELSPPVSPNEGLKLSSNLAHSTFTLNKDGSLEIMEQELQAMIQHLEELIPQVTVLANDSRVEKEKVISALSEMEDAVQKLSHLSFEMSTGSTDL